MNVNSVTNSYSAQGNGTSGTSSTATATYENFLKLLMAQMKNQDPTEPMKSTEYMSQLATFSQVEQTVKTNTKLDALLTSAALTQVDGVIGRTVSTVDGTVSGEVISVVITNEGAVAKLKGGEALLLGPGVVVS
jgi:flagellar basal-body rod modification protein FlgD